ncbi:MAG: MBL fold metallo-hydrolase, partial [Spirochaetales bacterium]|nr:MBL fold metallo-hydrolase [Spirochaetales bacterium]
MRITNLTGNSSTYTANVYFVRGSWNAIEDVNTLVDVGRDPAIIAGIDAISGGVGKKKIDQVILTHSHYDHASLLPVIKEIYNPVVYAFSPYLEGVDYLLKEGEKMKIGDSIFEVIHIPVHSSDSVCLYCEEEGVLFSGDTPVIIRSSDEIYDDS